MLLYAALLLSIGMPVVGSFDPPEDFVADCDAHVATFQVTYATLGENHRAFCVVRKDTLPSPPLRHACVQLRMSLVTLSRVLVEARRAIVAARPKERTPLSPDHGADPITREHHEVMHRTFQDMHATMLAAIERQLEVVRAFANHFGRTHPAIDQANDRFAHVVQQLTSGITRARRINLHLGHPEAPPHTEE
ncbi:hypothetical protein HYV74_03965 [Candidatus Uhrbacteria bacterium]|nr:hypothetical protein [Candidatus Uhrbacteria bacterium]